MKPRLLLAILAALPAFASAQTLTGVKVEPATLPAGGTATITTEFDISSGALNCGLRLHFGDGSTTDYKINQPKDVPLVVTHAYAKAGRYEIMAEPKRNGMILGCQGKNQRTPLSVTAAAAPAAKGGSVACPEGWKLDTKSVNKKTGAFTCTAKAGTPAPAEKLACPGDLGYFEAPKKGQIGCRP